MAGTLVANTINTDTGLFSTNNAYKGIAKAWVNFSSTPSSTSIRASLNVSSVTYSSVGQFTVNFATAMVDANYCMAGSTSGNGDGYILSGASYTTTSCIVWSRTSATFIDATYQTVMFVGN